MNSYLSPRYQIKPHEIIWKITSWEISADYIFKGTYTDAKNYADKLLIRNPQITPIDYNQISNNQRHYISFITENSVNDKKLENNEFIDSDQTEQKSPNLILKEKISFPKLDLAKIDKPNINIIDAPSARQLALSSSNQNYIRLIGEKITEKAKLGYNWVNIDLDELLSSPDNSKKLFIRNLMTSPKSPLRTSNDINNINHLKNFFVNLGYDVKIDVNSMTIYWF